MSEYKTEADLAYERYDNAGEPPLEEGLPEDDFREVNTQTVQSITQEPGAADVEFYTRSEWSPQLGTRYPENTGEYPDPAGVNDLSDEDTELEDIPDADDIQEDSPVDPSAMIEDMHGTDLINGYDGDDSE
ncbi:hypothetical protein GRF59_25335 [Paenibacillus sp. HJL G12]|uniref:Uncharacterized protein n=1 Tax=Paenibacillus dendrobii TaxID=2691084 RepID=A0A7X3LKY3_9BACL|nr:hypothetical protein [Paenibacillus dendrobii]MWV46939.1 hypothetical protein [Paenibacillus dendrobii]